MRWENRPLAKRIVSAAAIAAVIVGGVAAWIAVPPRIEPDKVGVGVAIDPALIERGRYLAQVGDCVACHTEKGGTPMAGGLALETPFGTVWSTNITPDPKTGIGSWSFGAFDRAMRKGVSRDGHRLYPAMPYPSFAKVHEEDMRALWAYLSKGLAPVDKANRAAEMRFPFGFRLGLAYWNAVFLDTTPFVPNPQKDALWNRGAYLVQGLGHCGACHTPRGLGFQEKAMSDAGRDGRLYVSGAQVEDWNAVDLRDVWAVEDMVKLLKTGQNRFATVSGSMTEVIHLSTQHISNDDLVAIATYLKALPSDRPKATPRPVSTANAIDDLHQPRWAWLHAILQRLPSAGRRRSPGRLSAARQKSDRGRKRRLHSRPHCAHGLEDRLDRRTSTRLYDAGLRSPPRSGDRRHPELRARELG